MSGRLAHLIGSTNTNPGRNGWLAIGVGLGTAVGVATGSIAVGVGVGLALGVALSRRAA